MKWEYVSGTFASVIEFTYERESFQFWKLDYGLLRISRSKCEISGSSFQIVHVRTPIHSIDCTTYKYSLRN